MPVGPSSRAQDRVWPNWATFGGYIIGKHGIAQLEDFAPDLDDPAEASALHSGDDLLQYQ